MSLLPAAAEIADTIATVDTVEICKDSLISSNYIGTAIADSTNSIKLISDFSKVLNMPKEEIVSKLVIWGGSFLIKVLLALLVWYVGKWVICRIKAVLTTIMNKRKVDASLQSFLINTASIASYIILIAIVIGTLGFNTSSFLALFASFGVAIGLALSGTMQNFAGGIMLLLFKPFKAGDYIEAQGFGGTVRSVQLTATVITTPDNKTVMLPNGPVFTGAINNFSRERTRRVDWIFGISYGDDFDKAKELITNFIEEDQRILKNPAHFIALKELGAHSVDLTVRAWVKSADYWGVFFDMNEKVYKGFKDAGLNIPFQQLDVHLHNSDDK